MTNEQEAIAEKILELHKVNHGTLDWTATYYEQADLLFPAADEVDKYEQMEFIKATLCELGLIEITNNAYDKTRITQKGFSFKSFEAERKKQKKERREERVKSFPQRYWWLVGLAAYFGGWGTELMRDKYLLKQKQDTTQSKQAIPPKEDSSLKPQPDPHR